MSGHTFYKANYKGSVKTYMQIDPCIPVSEDTDEKVRELVNASFGRLSREDVARRAIKLYHRAHGVKKLILVDENDQQTELLLD